MKNRTPGELCESLRLQTVLSAVAIAAPRRRDGPLDEGQDSLDSYLASLPDRVVLDEIATHLAAMGFEVGETATAGVCFAAPKDRFIEALGEPDAAGRFAVPASLHDTVDTIVVAEEPDLLPTQPKPRKE